MAQSYLDRAKCWFNTAEDVDIEIIELTICRFEVELKQTLIGRNINKAKDLKETISYFKRELLILAGIGELPNKYSEPKSAQYIAKNVERENHKPDLSPLVDISEGERINISPELKCQALLQIKSVPGVFSASELVRKYKVA